MARNEEKQQGRLNRLWLQKEREEGRLKDKRETRPKLFTLNTAASVKKWIPSIKNDIEYYLQQSQLTHYPERKIAEFQLKLEALEKEYKSFITKLRVLDPSCKHHPWAPRAYCKRRADQQDSHTPVKKPHATLTEGSDEDSCGGTSVNNTNLKKQTTAAFRDQSESRTMNQVDIKNADQDLPLSFDQSRLAVAVASFRGPSAVLGLTHTNNLARVLQSGLPNLATRYSNHKNTDKNLIQETARLDEGKYPVPVQEEPLYRNSTATASEKETSGSTLGGHLLGLDCYSSSDDEDET